MSDSPRPTGRRFVRPSLRQATLILPSTGERVKRVFTLRNPARERDIIERTPLIHPEPEHEDAWYQRLSSAVKDRIWKLYSFAISRTGQGILKCSLAYVLGSMATFVPFLRDYLGKNDGKHMVATVTVYFHPARSTGSMEEAILLAFTAFIYAAFVSFTGMAVSVFFDRHNLLTLGHVIVLIVFCGGALGFVGWLKQKLGNPLVNVACSLTSLVLITVLTKEGSIQSAQFSYVKVVQVLKIVVMGCIASAAVSFLVKPVSARKQLRDDIRKATDCLGIMMTTITRCFLSGSEEELKSETFLDASKQYKVIFKAMVKDLGEAKYEHYLAGTEEAYHIVARLVKCLERLSLDISGLRSAATTQFSLLEKSSRDGILTPVGRSLSDSAVPGLSHQDLAHIEHRFGGLASIEEISEGHLSEDDGSILIGSRTIPSEAQTAVTAADIFSVFITHLGPPMKSLAYTLGGVLEELPYGPAPKYSIVVNAQLRRSLVDANELFIKARREALTLVYKNKVPSKTRTVEVAADYEEVAASCGYFSSSLQDLAEDTIKYLDILQELKDEYERSPRQRSWKWLLFWRRRPVKPCAASDSDRSSLVVETAEQGLSQEIPTPRAIDENITNRNVSAAKQLHYQHFWKAIKFFGRDDIRYAIKVGVGAILYAAWSFYPPTRPLYAHWRGEWGLVSYMLVCSMTIGASNTTGFQRFFGTCIAAVCAIIAWLASNANAFLLGLFGWIVSLGCFYLIVGKGKGPMGRFILLTYNLSALYAYSLSVKDDDNDDDEGGASPDIWEIVLHRVVAVMAGCLWGIIITRVIFPISARRKLKDGICVLWLRMSLIWKRDPLTMLLEGASKNSYMDIRESLELQRFHTHLETLRKAAASEFEFKGPFPDKAVKRILESTSRMLDAFHAMNVVIMKDLKASPGEAELLRYTKQERIQLSSRISHLFSVLASSYKLEYPLNDAMPSTEHARDRLLAKIFEFRKINVEGNIARDEDYELLYCYALVTGQLAQEIQIVGDEIEKLYGVLDEDTLKLE